MMEQYIVLTVVYLAEAIIAWLFFGELFERKKSMPICLLSYAIAYSVCFALYDIPIILINTFVFILCNFLIILFCYNSRWGSALLYSVVFSVLVVATEAIGMLILWLFYGDFDIYRQSISGYAQLASLSKILLFLATRICMHFVKGKETENKPHGSSAVFLLISSVASVIVILALIHCGLEVPAISWSTEIWMAVGALAVLLADILIFSAYQQLQDIDNRYVEVVLQQQKAHSDAEYYSALKDQYESQRLLIHDIRHHADVVSTLASEHKCEDIEKYISDLENLPQLQRRVSYCRNTILNAILLRYGDICRQKDIAFSSDVRDFSLDFMDSMEITSIFSNLLENAVEAADGVKDAYIDFSLEITQSQSTVLCVVRNSCLIPPKKNKQGKIVSRKKDDRPHGIGLQNIRHTIEKYDGNMNQRWDESQLEYVTTITFRAQ